METINQVNQNLMADDIKDKCLKTKHVNKTADINANMNAFSKNTIQRRPRDCRLLRKIDF